MMRQVDLLPVTYAETRRARRNLGIAVGGGMVALLLLVGWWFMLGGQVSGAQSDLADAQSRNAELTSQIAELQRFADLELEVQAKETALRTVMAGDVAWPSLMTEIAMVLPGEVWLTEMTASAGLAEGASPVGTETALVRVNDKTPIGRIQFAGQSLTMPGVAKWVIELSRSKGFAGEWLDVAQLSEGDEGATPTFEFTSTIELTGKAASGRFLRGTP